MSFIVVSEHWYGEPKVFRKRESAEKYIKNCSDMCHKIIIESDAVIPEDINKVYVIASESDYGTHYCEDHDSFPLLIISEAAAESYWEEAEKTISCACIEVNVI